jgi:hypothetical protein
LFIGLVVVVVMSSGRSFPSEYGDTICIMNFRRRRDVWWS